MAAESNAASRKERKKEETEKNRDPRLKLRDALKELIYEDSEEFWLDNYGVLASRGYILRRRYQPDQEPTPYSLSNFDEVGNSETYIKPPVSHSHLFFESN
jgi:hypothetical protein